VPPAPVEGSRIPLRFTTLIWSGSPGSICTFSVSPSPFTKLAEAEKQAKTIKAQGEAEATQIYADSYSRNTELFDFLRSMDAYRKSMGNGGNIIVTDEDNEFFKHMK
jgi:hypothetical protein